MNSKAQPDELAKAIATAAAAAIAEKLTAPARHIPGPVCRQWMEDSQAIRDEGFTDPALSAHGPERNVPFGMNVFLAEDGQDFVTRYVLDMVGEIAHDMNAAGAPVVTFELPLPDAALAKALAVVNGVAVRFLAVYDVMTDEFTCRINVLFAHESAGQDARKAA